MVIIEMVILIIAWARHTGGMMRTRAYIRRGRSGARRAMSGRGQSCDGGEKKHNRELHGCTC